MDARDGLIPEGQTDGLTLFLAGTLVRRWKLILLAAAILAVVLVAFSYLSQPRFRARSVLLPQGEAGNSGLIAAIGNFANIPVQGEQNLETYYPVIVKSDQILNPLLRNNFPFRGEYASLFDIFGIADEVSTQADSLRSAERLKRHLRERVIGLNSDKSTGVMELSVIVPGDPGFAADFANALTDSLDQFVEGFNREKTRKQLSYIQQRIDEVSLELLAAEEDLALFKEENRSYSNSPRLTQVAAEKARHVQALTGVWVELIKQMEIAKIDDTKERYSIEILDRAQPPLHKFRPQRARLGFSGFVLGALISSLFVVLRSLTAVAKTR